MHSCNQWNQIDLQVTYSVLQFVAMETKGRVCHAPYRVHISLLADLSDLLFRSTPLKHCGVFMFIMSNVVLLNANHCCITKGQKDEPWWYSFHFALGNRQFCSYFSDENQMVVCDEKGAHKAIVWSKAGLREWNSADGSAGVLVSRLWE